jgi:hypothetical protein
MKEKEKKMEKKGKRENERGPKEILKKKKDVFVNSVTPLVTNARQIYFAFLVDNEMEWLFYDFA